MVCADCIIPPLRLRSILLTRQCIPLRGWRISALGERQVFSAYKRRGNYIEIELDITIEELYMRLPRLVEDIKPDFSKRDINNIREYMDALELEKVRIGNHNLFP